MVYTVPFIQYIKYNTVCTVRYIPFGVYGTLCMHGTLCMYGMYVHTVKYMVLKYLTYYYMPYMLTVPYIQYIEYIHNVHT